jgi:hypothetical protein
MCIILGSFSLGIGPTVMVWKAARRLRPRSAVPVALLTLAWVLAVEAAGPVCCTTCHLQAVCDDGTGAVSTWSSTLHRWQTTVTEYSSS